MINRAKELKYPVGIQTFSNIIKGGYVYIDKTHLIQKLIDEGKYYFLSRPRRFGKSLFLSTLESFFKGEHQLFKGLAIDEADMEWEEYPVLHLDFNNREYKNYDSLLAELNAHLEKWELHYGDEKKHRAVEERFEWIIEKAYKSTGKQVVILVDEYDKPLISAIGNKELSELYRSTLKAFYSNLKSLDRYIKFAMLSGVARFSKVSVFSDLNNLRDISFEEKYTDICGITNREIEKYLKPGIKKLSEKLSKSYVEIEGEIKQRYDGYHFSEESPDIYNPFSLMNLFAKEKFGNFWFESGTPEFLVSLIKNGGWLIKDIAPIRFDAEELASAGILSKNPIPVLYQTGYLTIKGYDSIYNEYILDYPNVEVKNSFLKFLLRNYLNEESSSHNLSIQDFSRDIKEGNPTGFMKRFDSLLAGLGYSDKGSPEARFQDAVYLIFTLLGDYAVVERRTAEGRIDLTVETSDFIYIFEFKINSDANEALDQIKKKEYWAPFRFSNKKIFLIGASFDSKTRKLKDFTVEEM
ncbi:MAG: ATP-binding protein [Muribaculaceae bacterium]|nr:ATP-binding protein [Muribaculaceae bacterium]